MAYRVLVLPTARKAILRLPDSALQRVRAAIGNLAAEPRPVGCTKLAGDTSIYRVRVGEYRILYEVRDAELVVLVVRVGHRLEVYRDP